MCTLIRALCIMSFVVAVLFPGSGCGHTSANLQQWETAAPNVKLHTVGGTNGLPELS